VAGAKPRKKKIKKTSTRAAQSALVVFYTTFDSREEARSFAHKVIESRLAACVNIVPHVTSVYFWQGQIHEDAEIFCIGKTTLAKFERLKSEITSLHSYRLPELVALPIVSGHEPYLKWIENPAIK
jgi:periplasmic divalent cation tolerance protein